MSLLQVGVHHKLDCQSILVACVEDLQIQLRNLLQESAPPQGLQTESNSDAQPTGPAVQFDFGTPQETQPGKNRRVATVGE